MLSTTPTRPTMRPIGAATLARAAQVPRYDAPAMREWTQADDGSAVGLIDDRVWGAREGGGGPPLSAFARAGAPKLATLVRACNSEYPPANCRA